MARRCGAEAKRKSGEAAVDISQVYETSVADRASGHALRFLIVPHRAFTAAIQHDDPSPKDALESVLGLQAIRPISPAALPLAVPRSRSHCFIGHSIHPAQTTWNIQRRITAERNT
jgi:hypothetical protein